MLIKLPDFKTFGWVCRNDAATARFQTLYSVVSTYTVYIARYMYMPHHVDVAREQYDQEPGNLPNIVVFFNGFVQPWQTNKATAVDNLHNYVCRK